MNQESRFMQTGSGLLVPDRRLRQINVVVVKRDVRGRERVVATAKNLVTTAGATYYAQRGAAESPTNTFNRLALGTGNGGAWAAGSTYSNLTGPIAGSILAFDSGYPKSNDDDTANTGRGATVISWRRTYTSSDFTSGTPITDAVITVTGPSGASPILTGFTFSSSFTLASGESVKIFVNHTVTPV